MKLYTIFFPNGFSFYLALERAGIKNYTSTECIAQNENNENVQPTMVRIEILVEDDDTTTIQRVASELNSQFPERTHDYEGKNRGIILESSVTVYKIKDA